MPFTPFHLGPGALFKSMGGEHFSFLILGGSQVLMDVEPLVRMIRGAPFLHGPSHSLAGALAIAVVSAAVGRPAGKIVLRQFGVGDNIITWGTALTSALIGTYSHIALDAVMHRDMDPLWPIAQGNGLLGMLSVGTLHTLCVASGLIGGGFLAYRARRGSARR